jgi:hypothetical protein
MPFASVSVGVVEQQINLPFDRQQGQDRVEFIGSKG